MPNFDCGGDRCGEFSCSSCHDDETRKEYWALLRSGSLSDHKAREIMSARLDERAALARKAPQLEVDLARVTAERDETQKALSNLGSVVERQAADIATLRSEVEAMQAVVELCVSVNERLQEARMENYEDGYRTIFKGGGYDLVAELKHALDALRAQKAGQ